MIYAYLPQSSSGSSRQLLDRSRNTIAAYAERRGLKIDREFLEAPGDHFVDPEGGDYRATALAERPIGGQLCELLKPGDEVIVDGPLLEASQMAAQIMEWCERGIVLHLARTGLCTRAPFMDGLPFVDDGVFPVALQMFRTVQQLFEGARRSEGTKIGMARAKARGGSIGGRPAPGWKYVKTAAGVKRVPDHEQRSVMMHIVKKRHEGWGWRRIASWLAKERVMWKKPDRSMPRGYTLEFWCMWRCKRAFAEMMAIMASEQVAATGTAS